MTTTHTPRRIGLLDLSPQAAQLPSDVAARPSGGLYSQLSGAVPFKARKLEGRRVAVNASRTSLLKLAGASALAFFLSLSPINAATIGFDSAGAFRGVTPDIYIGGKGAPIVDLPAVTADPVAINNEWVAYVVFGVLLIALLSGSDSDPVSVFDPIDPVDPVTPQPAPVPLPAGLVLLLSGLGALAWMARRG